jgi:putative tryptophan/tyrosine transport system substrate-binding protein
MRKAGVLSVLFLVVLLAAAVIAEAQQPKKVPRIGYLSSGASCAGANENLDAFRQGLNALGYVEGKNIYIECRSAEGKFDRLPSLVAELVHVRVDVFIMGTLIAVRAAKQASTTIPIVMALSVDPVATGLVNSLASPGGNITGLTNLARDLSGKRLELLKEVVPEISRVGVLRDANDPSAALGSKEYEVVASAMKVQLQSLPVRGPNPDLGNAFQAAVNGHANGLITIRGALFNRYLKQIAELAIKNRLPSMHEGIRYVEPGGLMSYATNDVNQWRRAATYVDKILKGAKPADLPVEQPTKFEFVINLKTAKQIGVTIPPNVLARADKVIR